MSNQSMQPLKSDNCGHDYKDSSIVNVTPLDSEVDELNDVVHVSSVDDNNIVEHNRKRSFDEVDSSKGEATLSDSSLQYPNSDFQGVSTLEAQSNLASRSFHNADPSSHDEKRFRPANMDDPNPTVHEHMFTTNGPPPIPPQQGNENDGNITTTATSHEDTETKHEKIETKALTFNASSWSVGPRYQLLRLLGRGSYGEVAEALDLYQTADHQKVAIKRIITTFDKEVDAIRLFREIHILRRLRGHACIIQLLDIIPQNTDNPSTLNNELYLVFEYVDTDLYKLIMSPQYLTTEHIQTFLYQILLALKYMHSSAVIHRDLKPANILLNEDCSLKICDFGLARIIDESKDAPTIDDSSHENGLSDDSGDISTLKSITSLKHIGASRQLTKHVTTRWYRAPELILIQPYSSAVDIWSVGCIFAELLSMQKEVVPLFDNRSALFPGGSCYPLSSDISPSSTSDRFDQLSAIFQVLGPPSEEDIGSVSSASKYIQSVNISSRRPLESIFENADKAALDLLNKMLQFNPNKRITAAEAIEHEYLRSIRRPDMEISADKPFESPEFLKSDSISIEEINRWIYEEINYHKIA